MLDWLFEKTPLHFMIQSFWRDEGFSYVMAKMPISEMVVTTAKDFNPPLYYFLLHFWIQFFGSSEVTMRSLSLIFYTLTIYVFYLFLENVLKLKKLKVAIYILLFAANPLLVYYAFEARMYMMFAFLSSLSFYFFFTKNKWGYTIATILGMYTHYYFFGVLLTQGIYMLLTEKRELKNIIKKCELFLIPALAFLPWFLYIFENLISQSTSFWMSKLTSNDFVRLPGALFNGYEGFFYDYYDQFIVRTSVIIALFIIAGIFLRKKHDKLLLFSSLWAFGFYLLIAVVSIVKPIFVPRYLIFATVGLHLFLVITLERMKTGIQILLIALLFFMTYHYTRLEVKEKTKGDIRRTLSVVRSMMQPGDRVYVKDAANYFVAVYYAPEEEVYVYEYLDRIPAYVGLAAIPRDKIVQDLPVYPHKAFILTGDTGYEIKSDYR